MFRTNDVNRFRIPRKKSIDCRKLRVEGVTYSDNNDILKCWKDHFEALGQSRSLSGDNIYDSNFLCKASLDNFDNVLDDDIELKEVEGIVKYLKNGKSPGPDGISAEHWKHGGPAVLIWLKRIFNTIISLECIPPSFNDAIIVPIYKGKGHDPTNCNSYRGISLTSVLAKCFEKLILDRVLPVLEEHGFPHQSQTAYIRNRSCMDGIFMTSEVARKLLSDGDSPYLCFFDLDKAFDSNEFDVLLHHLFHAGVNGKTWRLIKSWYSNPTSKVRFNNTLSEPYILSRGVKQGSVLSPILFCLVMNRMSIDMDADRYNLLLTGVSVGCASHADDIRTCNIGLSEIKSQAESISVFAGKNSLSLNKTKTEVVHLSRANFEPESINLCGGELVSKKSAKCLGVWWSHDLSSRKSIEENIKKARRAFFALGAMNVYNGKCNPLTSLSVFNSCVLPILLYGCETWFLSDPLLNLLDKFKAEVGKRILKLSVTHNSIFPLIGLHWPSFRVVILYRKLRLLSKLLSNNSNDSSGRVFRTLAAHDLLKIGLVEQCRELELSFGTDILPQCLHSPAGALDILCQLGLYWLMRTGKELWSLPPLIPHYGTYVALRWLMTGLIYGM